MENEKFHSGGKTSIIETNSTVITSQNERITLNFVNKKVKKIDGKCFEMISADPEREAISFGKKKKSRFNEEGWLVRSSRVPVARRRQL